MSMIVENAEPKDREQLSRELTGPFRTVGGGLSPEEMTAPSWWHGDEEAYESVAMGAMLQLPQRGRGRR